MTIEELEIYLEDSLKKAEESMKIPYKNDWAFYWGQRDAYQKVIAKLKEVSK